MDIQQFNPKLISITHIRRDIDTLEKTLAKTDEAFVMRNQSVLFVALTPKRYQELTQSPAKQQTTEEAITRIDHLRKTTGRKKGRTSGTQSVIRLRDEQTNEWKR